ncbi:hypothetical protein [Nocardioides sp. J54]|uniref:hypothetical protein n=1 Tax=Nocardioides sp. J54 TaxID=935866 RepID=UPI00049062CB|nr:hypothetical protein [Nocardioides sp. J54]
MTTSSITGDIVAATYVRRTVDRLTAATRQPGQDSIPWDLTHLNSIISTLDARGYGDAIREAADDQARLYELPTQAEVEKTTPRCPVWCTRTDHHADVVDADHPPIHYGPELSDVLLLQAEGDVPEAIVTLANEALYVRDPEELEKVAADMVQAAEWIKAHR